MSLLVTLTRKQAVRMLTHTHPAWTVTKFNVPPQRLVKENVRITWKNLEDLDIPAVSSDQIGLLIGVQVKEAMIQHEYRRGQKGQPYAVRTDFGWAIAGLAGEVPSPRTSVSFVGHCATLDTGLNEEVKAGGRQSHLVPSSIPMFQDLRRTKELSSV